MIEWFYSFTKEITTKDMEHDSLNKIHCYIDHVLNRGEVNVNLVNATEVWSTKSFETNLYRMYQQHYMGVPAGFEALNRFTESANAQLYRGHQAPKMNNELHISGEKIHKGTKRVYNSIKSCDSLNL